MSAKPVNCRFFFADYHRGRDIEECRLIKRNPQSRPWRRPLCDSCPVPGILVQTNCQEIALEASVERKWAILDRVEVYAICAKHLIELKDPNFCPQCAQSAPRAGQKL